MRRWPGRWAPAGMCSAPRGAAFEAEFAAWLGGPHAVGCGNGTDALALALRGLGIGPGSAVATVSHTAVATVAAIEMAGATPLLIDIDPAHYTMDPDELAAVLASPPAGLPPIRAVMPVHLVRPGGRSRCDLPLCRAHGVALIEDCAQAHGATLARPQLGTFGDVGTFSFYPTKNLGALGDGGAVATRRCRRWRRGMAALRQYGWRQHYISDEVGVNSRLDELQAAILRVKLPHLDAQNARRRAIAAGYDAALAGGRFAAPARRPAVGARVPPVRGACAGPRRGAGGNCVRRASAPASIIRCRCICSRPIAAAWRLVRGVPRDRARRREVLSLPMYPELTGDQVAQVCEALRSL